MISRILCVFILLITFIL